LAAAGILDGHRAATHWAGASQLATEYPNVTVEPDAIYVHDRRVWTSAGGTSGIDLALALIEQDAGRKVALHVARLLVIYLKRAGGQSQYRALLDAQAHSESDGFAGLEEWIVENLKSDLRVQALARRVHMSPRNFARVYAQTRGRTPAKAIEAIRIDAARRRLEESTDRIETIAAHTGFTSEEQMRSAFTRSLGIPLASIENVSPPQPHEKLTFTSPSTQACSLAQHARFCICGGVDGLRASRNGDPRSKTQWFWKAPKPVTPVLPNQSVGA
jgi:transcriptional regulator GlxA family with amidase domain